MNPTTRSAARSLAALLLAAGTLAASPAGADAQAAFGARSLQTSRAASLSPGLAAGKYVVVINLDENKLYFTRNRRVLWSAPVGTGTGLRLEGPSGEWDFSTPDGVFHVQYKEEAPVWMAPDWYFVENKLPIPPADSPKRRFPGGLGAAAVYIGQGLAIHGTDKPDLLGQRVSHGCIRLANRDALRLFHNVQLGTEVVIVGGGRRDEEDAPAPAARPRVVRDTRPAAPQKDPYAEYLAALPTDELAVLLDDEIRADAAGEETRWPQVASTLFRRGIKDGDEGALRSALTQMEVLQGGGRISQEYATYLADAYARAPRATLRALSEMDRVARTRAAAAIVDATLTLYPGDAAAPVTPWPTGRIPESMLEADEERGWAAVRQAELSYRQRNGLSVPYAAR